jgi:hypothetical protein
MFEMMMAEKLISQLRSSSSGVEPGQALGKPVRFRASMTDRFLAVLGQLMVNLGRRLIDRSCTAKAAEQAHAPNFLIML